MSTSPNNLFAHSMPAIRQLMEGFYSLCQRHTLVPRLEVHSWCQRRIGRKNDLCFIIEKRPGHLTEAINELIRRGLIVCDDEYYWIPVEDEAEAVEDDATAVVAV